MSTEKRCHLAAAEASLYTREVAFAKQMTEGLSLPRQFYRMPHEAERRHALWQLHAEALLRRAHLGKLHAVHVLHRPDRPCERAAVRSDDLHFVAHGKLVPQAQHGVPIRIAGFDHRTDLPLPDLA